MATTYEEKTVTSSSSDGIGLDRPYLTSMRGLLKVAEIVTDLVAFICASIYAYWGRDGGGWVQFVTISAFITTLLLYGFHLFRIIYKLPGPWGLIQLIYYFAYSLMLLISAIVCAARAYMHSSIGAAAELIYYFAYSVMLLIAAIVSATRGHWHSSIGAAAELIYYGLYSLMLLIAGIVCAARASWHSSIGAAAFFTFAATAMYVFDTFLMFREWQMGRSGTTTSQTTTTTTTTHETYETRVQY